MRCFKSVLALFLCVAMTMSGAVTDSFAAEISSQQYDETESQNQISMDQQAMNELLGNIAEQTVSEETVPEVSEETVSEDDMSADEYGQWKKNYMEQINAEELSEATGALSGNVSNTASPKTQYVRNDIIEAFVGTNGRYTIGTVNGSDLTTDNNKKLTYGHPGSDTSFTTVKIDGVNHIFSGNQTMTQTDGDISVGDRIDNIDVTQNISIVNNDYTGKDDTIAITYTIKNYDSSYHSAGIRIMIDTMLGNNDGAPFRVPGYGNVTNELELKGGNIPQNWMAFDKIEDPQVIADGCFYKTIDDKPDEVQFASWRKIHSTEWDYDVSDSVKVTGDSAVAMYYEPENIGPGETRTVTTYYGIGDFCASNTVPPLSTKIVAPTELVSDKEEGGYTQDPFSVTAYIENTGGNNEENVYASLVLPKNSGLSLVYPAINRIDEGRMGKGEERTATWLVYAAPQTKTDKTVNYSVNIGATGVEEKTVKVATKLPRTKAVNDSYTITLDKKKLSLDVDSNYYYALKVTCSDGKKRAVTWFSSNPNVATVNKDGVVKAISSGTVNIIASVGKRSACCSVSVKGESVGLKSLKLNRTTAAMKKGDFLMLTPIYTPSDSFRQKGVKWNSSNPSVATVDESGKVIAISAGTSRITATSNADVSKKAECSIQVGSDAQNLSLSQSVGFNQSINGPTVDIIGKKKPLFTLPMDMELQLDEDLGLEYDQEEDSYVGTFGFKDIKGDAKENLKKFKMAEAMLKKNGVKKFVKGYNNVLSKSGSPFIAPDPSVDIFGYIKLQRVNDDLKVSEGEVYVVIDSGELGVKGYLPAAPCFYAKISVEGTVNTGLKFVLDEYGIENMKTVKVNGTLSVEGSLKIGIGADILIAGVEGGLEGDLTVDFAKLIGFVAQQDLSIKVSASAYISAHALFFLEGDWKWKFAEAQLYPAVDNDGAGAVDPAGDIDLNPDNMLPMASGLPAADNISSQKSTSGLYAVQELSSGGYSYASPDITMLSDGRYIAVWSNEVSGRSEFDRTGIYYSIMTDGEWSDAALVDDDGTADFAPVVAAAGNGAYIAWQNEEKTFGDASVSMNDMIPNVGIKAAYFNGSTIAGSAVLTANGDHFDNIPQISADINGADVIWDNNSADDWTCCSGINTVKCCSIKYDESLRVTDADESYKESAVSIDNCENEPVSVNAVSLNAVSLDAVSLNTVSENDTKQESISMASENAVANGEQNEISEDQIESVSGMNAGQNITIFSGSQIVTDYDVSIYDGKSYVVLSRDADSELSTSADKINEIYIDGNENAGMSSAVAGTMPVFSENASGTDIYWYDGKGIKKMKGMDPSAISYCVDMTAGESFKVTENGDRAAIYWTENGLSSAALKVSAFEEGVWTDPVEIYSYPGSLRGLRCVLTDTDDLIAVADEVEKDTSNNDTAASVMAMVIKQNVNLKTDGNLYFDNTDIVAGKQMTFSTDVTNTGLQSAKGINIELKKENGQVIGTSKTNEIILPGQTKTVSMNYTVPTGFAKTNITMTVKPANTDDIDDSDNSCSADVGSPLISITDMKLTGSGRYKIANVEVSNEGYAAENNVTVSLMSGSLSGNVLGNAAVNSIGARSKLNVSITIDMNKVNFPGSEGFVLYAQAQDSNNSLGNEAVYSVALNKPSGCDSITLESGLYEDKMLSLMINNNCQYEVSGNLIIELLKNDEKVFSVGQELQMASLDSSEVDFDMASLLLYPHDEICAYVINTDGVALSNTIFRNSEPYSADNVSITLDKSYIAMKKGEVQALTANMSLESVMLADIKWSSSNESVATVDQLGNIAAEGIGEARISVSSDIMGVASECRVVVTPDDPAADFKGAQILNENVTVDTDSMSGTKVTFAPEFRLNSLNSLPESEDAASSYIEQIVLTDGIAGSLFDTKIIDDAHFLLISTERAAADKRFANRSYTTDVYLKIKGRSEKVNIGTLKISTIAVLPKIKLSPAKLNSFYLNDSAALNAECQNGEISSVSIDGNADSDNPHPEYFNYEVSSDTVRVADGYRDKVKEGKYNIRFSVSVNGFRIPAQVCTAINVEDNAPELKLSAPNVKLRAEPNGNNAYMALKNVNKKAEDDFIISSVSLNSGSDKYIVATNGSEILIHNILPISGKEKIVLIISLTGGSRQLEVPVEIEAIEKTGTYTLSKKSVVINAPVDLTSLCREIRINGAADNDSISAVRVTEMSGRKETAPEKLKYQFNPSERLLSIGLTSGSLKAGNYKMRIYPDMGTAYVELIVKVTRKFPVFKSDVGSMSLNTQNILTKTFRITNNMDLDSNFTYYVLGAKSKIKSGILNVNIAGGDVSVTPYSYASDGKYTLVISSSKYYGSKPVKIKVAVVSQPPRYTLSKRTIELNKALKCEDETAYVDLKSNMDEALDTNVYLYEKAPGKRSVFTYVSDFSIQKNGCHLSIQRSNNSLATGTYSIKMVSESYSKSKPVIIKIKVVNKKPSFKQKGKIMLNSGIAPDVEKYAIEISGGKFQTDMGTFEFFQKQNKAEVSCSDVNIAEDGGTYYVSLNPASSLKKGKIVLYARSSVYSNADPFMITVNVTDRKPVLHAELTGKIDTTDSYSYVQGSITEVEYTQIKPDEAGNLTLSSNNFELYRYDPASMTFRIRLKDQCNYDELKKDKPILCYTDGNGNTINSSQIKIGYITPIVKGIASAKEIVLCRNDPENESNVSFTLSRTNAAINSVSIEGNSGFAIRCVSKYNKTYAIGFNKNTLPAAGNYRLNAVINIAGSKQTINLHMKVTVK